MRLEMMRPAQIQAAAKEGLPVLLPMGVLENHGWHLPCGVDLLVSRGVAYKVEKILPAVVAPPLSYGPGVYLVGRPEMGSLEVGYEAFLPHVKAVLVGLLRMGFQHIFALAHHQGLDGQEALCVRLAASNLQAEFPRQHHPVWWGEIPPESQPARPNIQVLSTSGGRSLDPKYRGGDHAGFWETSMILGLHPELADLGELDRGEPWFSQREPHPRTCTEEFGREMMDAWAEALADEIQIRSGRAEASA